MFCFNSVQKLLLNCTTARWITSGLLFRPRVCSVSHGQSLNLLMIRKNIMVWEQCCYFLLRCILGTGIFASVIILLHSPHRAGIGWEGEVYVYFCPSRTHLLCVITRQIPICNEHIYSAGLPEVMWNSHENLERLHNCITALKLPPPPPAAVDGKIVSP